MITVTVIIIVDDHQHCRNYSLSDSPGGEVYRITVKREESGTVSGHLHHNLQVRVDCFRSILSSNQTLRWIMNHSILL